MKASKLTPAHVRRTALEIHRDGKIVKLSEIAHRLGYAHKDVWPIVNDTLGLASHIRILNDCLVERTRVSQRRAPHQYPTLCWLAGRLALPASLRGLHYELH